VKREVLERPDRFFNFEEGFVYIKPLELFEVINQCIE
jgi:hypothetical protein